MPFSGSGSWLARKLSAEQCKEWVKERKKHAQLSFLVKVLPYNPTFYLT